MDAINEFFLTLVCILNEIGHDFIKVIELDCLSWLKGLPRRQQQSPLHHPKRLAMPQDDADNGPLKLYDLKVTVIVPEESDSSHGEELLPCNARIGEYFELQGELLFLPPGQGMSIYSIGISNICECVS